MAGHEVKKYSAHRRVRGLADVDLLIFQVGRVVVGGLASGPVVLDEKIVRFVVRVLPIDHRLRTVAFSRRLLLDRRRRFAAQTLALGAGNNRIDTIGSQQGLVVFGRRRK